ncbi:MULTISPECIES: hypothetical protein [unclassified Pseudonocardia]|uniref:hypothetical protein n=1 Tax=unclassified Pseudonocardia TaxID=2619320 RepID=UPI00094AB874|nr:hypothetical protein [Pseudonocardia sp. Ae707_Ps1]OLM20394.1 hypothetical protein Ae707Ps1_4653 [Pseudonocardia sp. Ae707_Ps1]
MPAHCSILPPLVLAACAAVAVAGCGGGAPAPRAAPATTPPAAAAPAPPTTTAAPDPTCTGSMERRTDGRMSTNFGGGAGGTLQTSDAGTFVSCGDGPRIRIRIDPGAALVASFEGRDVRIGERRSDAVGPYRVAVTSLTGNAVRFTVTP